MRRHREGADRFPAATTTFGLNGEVQRTSGGKWHGEGVITPFDFFAEDIALTDRIAAQQVNLGRTEREADAHTDTAVATGTETNTSSSARPALTVLHAAEKSALDFDGDSHRHAAGITEAAWFTAG